MMQFAVAVLALLLVSHGYKAVVDERVLAVGTATQQFSAIRNRFPQGNPFPRTQTGFKPGLAHSRRLKQEEGLQRCTWRADDAECVISETAEIDIFAKSNSPNAQYFSDHMLCDNLADQESCYEAGCHWVNGQYCEFGVARREIVSCFRNATYFLHSTHHTSICSQLPTSAACEANGQCNWLSDYSYCDLDVFNLLTGVPSKDGIPEGYEEVFHLMWTAATIAFSEDFPTHRALINSIDAVLNWTPPPFSCPSDSDPLVCSYAEPVVKIFPVSVYCDVVYGRDWEGCEADALCTVLQGRVRRCGVSDAEISRRHYEAIDVYVDAIHDPFLRDVYATSVACSKFETLSECQTESCVWYADYGCTVSTAQIREAYIADLDDDSHPVCHMFVITERAQCGDFLTAQGCTTDGQCIWDDYDDACYTSEQAIIDYLLEHDTDLKNAFNKVAKRCRKQKTKKACSKV